MNLKAAKNYDIHAYLEVGTHTASYESNALFQYNNTIEPAFKSLVYFLFFTVLIACQTPHLIIRKSTSL
jgi:hypothetical protein